MTTGDVQVDGARVPGNSAIFPGNLIASGDRSLSLQFSDGTSAVMKPDATITVYREHSVLQKGVMLQTRADKHPMLADGLQISGTAADTIVIVGVRDDSHIEVATQQGESSVTTSSGGLVARVEPGRILSFTITQAPTQGPGQTNGPSPSGTRVGDTKLCGDLQPDFTLTDVETNVKYQVQGTGLEKLVGKSIRVNGTLVAGSPLQVVLVSSVKNLGHPCVQGAGAAPAAIVSRGLIPILILVSVGGTLLGVGLTGGFGGSSPPPVTPSVP